MNERTKKQIAQETENISRIKTKIREVKKSSEAEGVKAGQLAALGMELSGAEFRLEMFKARP